MRFKDWVQILTAMLILITATGSLAVWAGDKRWVTVNRLEEMEVNQLDREITFLQIKINEGEASSSERIYIQTLRQQLRAMK